MSIKENMILATINLIERSEGNIEDVTSRMIAKEANVSVGLINYHFQTKENLVEVSIQRIIESVITAFSMEGKEGLQGISLVIKAAQEVFEFLFNNASVSQISIQGDFMHPQEVDNTVKSIRGFTYLFKQCTRDDMEAKKLAFTLTATMQSAFLRRCESKELFGYDFTSEEERAQFIEELIMRLGGNNKWIEE